MTASELTTALKLPNPLKAIFKGSWFAGNVMAMAVLGLICFACEGAAVEVVVGLLQFWLAFRLRKGLIGESAR